MLPVKHAIVMHFEHRGSASCCSPRTCARDTPRHRDAPLATRRHVYLCTCIHVHLPSTRQSPPLLPHLPHSWMSLAMRTWNQRNISAHLSTCIPVHTHPGSTVFSWETEASGYRHPCPPVSMYPYPLWSIRLATRSPLSPHCRSAPQHVYRYPGPHVSRYPWPKCRGLPCSVCVTAAWHPCCPVPLFLCLPVSLPLSCSLNPPEWRLVTVE